MAGESTTDDFDWVSAQSGCRADLMFKKLLEGARKDVERRNAAAFSRADNWKFELHADDDDHFEVTRDSGSAKTAAFVTFERDGPRITIAGDGVDVHLTAIVGINHAGDCRYFIGESEYLAWEVRKQALDVLFFEDEEE